MTFDPHASLANVRHEFGEHGGVNMSIEASTSFTVMEADTMPENFDGRVEPETGGCYSIPMQALGQPGKAPESPACMTTPPANALCSNWRAAGVNRIAPAAAAASASGQSLARLIHHPLVAQASAARRLARRARSLAAEAVRA